MGKFSSHKVLSKNKINELFADFAKSLASLNSSVEAANFIRDLFSEQEVIMIARRLQIARLLNEGNTYAQIRKIMKVSDNTIAKVQTWLQMYGDGYRIVFSRVKPENSGENNKNNTPLSFGAIKKKYAMYFWPEILLKEIIRSSSRREKEKLSKIISQLKEKTKLSKDLEKLLN